ncbi:MAG: UDP-N-acetylmuramoyl-L-alanyl-D-glutamate--2,6-diaminopimelate ligase [Xanthomonadales bacterium]|nr:UDP-N-acetylmuramoyl-L-alanyl-D-glutamate--2,6-diaminopimelate ligase [Xanthomonadales bacterium]
MSARVNLATLLDGMADAGAAAPIEISGLSLDSRSVRAGEAFIALRGTQTHGLDFAAAAAARGAAAILAEPLGAADTGAVPPTNLPTVYVSDLRERLGEIAARFYDHPGADLEIIGVTGTNGKTSIVQLLAQALTALDRRSASIGTLGAGVHGALVSAARTTPDAISVQALLAAFRDDGVRDVAMEVSSHALVQGRVNAVPFALAVFTNLTRDHLDYHGNMQAYGAAKAKLFAWPGLRVAVINDDDAFGRSLAAGLPAQVRALRYGIASETAEVRASDVRRHSDGVDFMLHTPWGDAPVHSPLLGGFNVVNLLAVAACLGALDCDLPALVRTLQGLAPVAGRMQRLGGGDWPVIVIDYAHTPDALTQALASLREHARGKLICVFGAGGDRDRGKRAPMGAAAEAGADIIIVTDDNPRSEDGDAIAVQILAGMAQPQHARVIRDRRQAMATAISEARAGDIVLIAGKGHEAYQESHGEKRVFDDALVARELLQVRAC